MFSRGAGRRFSTLNKPLAFLMCAVDTFDRLTTTAGVFQPFWYRRTILTKMAPRPFFSIPLNITFGMNCTARVSCSWRFFFFIHGYLLVDCVIEMGDRLRYKILFVIELHRKVSDDRNGVFVIRP